MVAGSHSEGGDEMEENEKASEQKQHPTNINFNLFLCISFHQISLWILSPKNRNSTQRAPGLFPFEMLATWNVISVSCRVYLPQMNWIIKLFWDPWMPSCSIWMQACFFTRSRRRDIRARRNDRKIQEEPKNWSTTKEKKEWISFLGQENRLETGAH